MHHDAWSYTVLDTEPRTLRMLGYIPDPFLKKDVYGCLAFMYVCVPLTCLVLAEVRRGNWTLWDWSYRRVQAAM